jgi:hypothetical protein
LLYRSSGGYGTSALLAYDVKGNCVQTALNALYPNEAVSARIMGVYEVEVINC